VNLWANERALLSRILAYALFRDEFMLSDVEIYTIAVDPKQANSRFVSVFHN
jgi:hypothetical protein